MKQTELSESDICSEVITPALPSAGWSEMSERTGRRGPIISAPKMPPGAGSRLDAYELVALLGRGGMSEVWLATETKVGRRVALKLLPAELTQDAGRVAPVRAGSPPGRVSPQPSERLHNPRVRRVDRAQHHRVPVGT